MNGFADVIWRVCEVYLCCLDRFNSFIDRGVFQVWEDSMKVGNDLFDEEV